MKLTRRDFLKLSSVFGASALVPWIKIQPPDSPSYRAEMPQPDIDEIEADLTRVLFWVDDEPVRGIYEATLTFHSASAGVLLDECLLKPAREKRIVSECKWAGYPYRLQGLENKFRLGEPMQVKIGLPDKLMIHCGKAYLYEAVSSVPTRHTLARHRFREKTLKNLHGLLCCSWVFHGVGQWNIDVYGKEYGENSIRDSGGLSNSLTGH